MPKGIHDLPLNYDLTHGHEMQIRVHAPEGVDVESYINAGRGLMIDLVNEASFNSIPHIERKHRLNDGSIIVCRQSYGVQRIDIFPYGEIDETEPLPPDFICTPRSRNDAPYGWIKREGDWAAAESETEEALFEARRIVDNGVLTGYKLTPIDGLVIDGKFQPTWRAGDTYWTSPDGTIMISWMTGGRDVGHWIPQTEDEDYYSDNIGRIFMDGRSIMPKHTIETDQGVKSCSILGACLVGNVIIYAVYETIFYSQSITGKRLGVYKQTIDSSGEREQLYQEELVTSIVYGCFFSGNGEKAVFSELHSEYVFHADAGQGVTYHRLRVEELLLEYEDGEVTVTQSSVREDAYTGLYITATGGLRYVEVEGIHAGGVERWGDGSATTFGPNEILVCADIDSDGNTLTRTIPTPYSSYSISGVTAIAINDPNGNYSWWDSTGTAENDIRLIGGDTIYDSNQTAHESRSSSHTSDSVNDSPIAVDLSGDIEFLMSKTYNTSTIKGATVDDRWVVYETDEEVCISYSKTYSYPFFSSLYSQYDLKLPDENIAEFSGQVISPNQSSSGTITGNSCDVETSHLVQSKSDRREQIDAAFNISVRWAAYTETNISYSTVDLRQHAKPKTRAPVSMASFEYEDIGDGHVNSDPFSASEPGVAGSILNMDGHLFFSLATGGYAKDGLITIQPKALNRVLGEDNLDAFNAGDTQVLEPADAIIANIYRIKPDFIEV